MAKPMKLPERDRSQDSARLDYLLRDPEGARHLFLLLKENKGDAEAFVGLVDRIAASFNHAHGLNETPSTPSP